MNNETRLNPSDRPPAYEDIESHHYERSTPEPLPHAHPRLQSQSSPYLHLTAQLPPPVLSDITLDGTLIYPTTPPATALYAISNNLNLDYSTISVSRLEPRRSSTGGLSPNLNLRDKIIYKFTRPVMSETVEIIGQRRSTLPGILLLKSTRQLLKTGWALWHVYKNTESMVFRVKPKRNPEKHEVLEWQDGCGTTVAIETLATDLDDVQCDRSRARRPRLQIVSSTPLDDIMTDVLVTAWCARIWITF
ncbi:Alba superfamily domain-containing protein [Histoplasma ohiense]|nr:Alba superfamily domain-containing protein [Histoplasma ohiense (nom. inval.)]